MPRVLWTVLGSSEHILHTEMTKGPMLLCPGIPGLLGNPTKRKLHNCTFTSLSRRCFQNLLIRLLIVSVVMCAPKLTCCHVVAATSTS